MNAPVFLHPEKVRVPDGQRKGSAAQQPPDRQPLLVFGKPNINSGQAFPGVLPHPRRRNFYARQTQFRQTSQLRRVIVCRQRDIRYSKTDHGQSFLTAPSGVRDKIATCFKTGWITKYSRPEERWGAISKDVSLAA